MLRLPEFIKDKDSLPLPPTRGALARALNIAYCAAFIPSMSPIFCTVAR